MQIISKQNINIGRQHIIIGSRLVWLVWYLRFWFWLKRLMLMKVW